MLNQFDKEEKEKLERWYANRSKEEQKKIKEHFDRKPRPAPSNSPISPAEMEPSMLFELMKTNPELMRTLGDKGLLTHMKKYADDIDDKDMFSSLRQQISRLSSLRPPGI